jgi:hypothetical protein
MYATVGHVENFFELICSCLHYKCANRICINKNKTMVQRMGEALLITTKTQPGRLDPAKI